MTGVHEVADGRRAAHTVENVDHVGELVSSQKGAPQMHHSVHLFAFLVSRPPQSALLHRQALTLLLNR